MDMAPPEQWVLDATVAKDGPPWPFCPLEGDPNGEFEVVAGMTFVGDRPPGKFVGVVHADGDDAVAAWIEAHPGVMEAIA